MDKKILYFVLFVALFGTVTVAVKFCLVSSDCVHGKRCCERLCLSRKACSGLCSSDLDCDKEYGESCTLRKCSCVQPPCTLETINQNRIQECVYESQCYKNQTCKDGKCRSLDSITETKGMNPAVLGVVATIGLIIFVGAFYLCLRNQRSSRPSLATKQAHHHKQLMERERMNERNALEPNTEATVEIENSQSNEHHSNGKRRSDIKNLYKKPPITSGSSLIELSVVEEEDEISEIASN